MYINIRLFAKFDKHKRNYLTEDQLKQIVLRICPDLSDELIKIVYQKFDENENGKITFNEFSSTINQVN